MNNLRTDYRLLSLLLSFLVGGCAYTLPVDDRPTVGDSPNVNSATTLQRCLNTYSDLAKSTPDGHARIRAICEQSAESSARATQSDARKAAIEVEASRKAQEAQIRAELERARTEARAEARLQQAREQEQFDRSALGRALNSANRALETTLERKATEAARGSVTPSRTRTGDEPCPPGMFIPADMEEECARRAGRLASRPAGSTANARQSAAPAPSSRAPVMPAPIGTADARLTSPPVRSQADNKDGPGPVVRETSVVSCVYPERVQGEGNWQPMALVNRCPAIKVNVAFCIEGSRGPFRCRGKGFEGSDSIGVGKWVPIPDYFTDGGGKVILGACADPHFPVDFTGTEFKCRR